MKKTYGSQKTSSYFCYMICIVMILFNCPGKTLQKELKDVVRNFKCVTHNFDHYVNCTWELDVSEKEAESIRLNVTWQLVLPAFGSYFSLFVCPEQTKTSCTIKVREDNLDPDRKVIFHLLLTKFPNGGGENISFPVYLPSVVKPYKVSDLSGNSNSTCVNLSWSHSRNLYSLQYQIRYVSKWDFREKEVTVIGDEYADDDITRHTICYLQPYTSYTFKVRCRPQGGDGFWSEDVAIVIRTDKDVPSNVPYIPRGGFRSILDHHGYRHVEIFWHSLEKQHRNGDKVIYNLNVYRGKNKKNQITFSTPQTSAKLKHLLQNSTYRIEITPANEIGMSSYNSSISIPTVSDVPEGPKMVIARRETKSTVRVNWEPIKKIYISTVTLYWCKATAKSCVGSIQWTTFPATINSAILNISGLLDSSFLVGVSAETFTGISSGLHWSKCIIMDTSTHHGITVGIHSLHENRKVEIQWRFSSCAGEIFRGEISQFIVHICRTQPCKEKEIYNENGEMRSLLMNAKQGETICATVTAELKDGGKIQSEQFCDKIDEVHTIPLELIIPVSIFVFILVCLGVWCLWKTFSKKFENCMKPFEFDLPQPKKLPDTAVNADNLEVTVETPCIGCDSEQTEPSESLTPTSQSCLMPILDSGGYVLRDSGN